jgi:hypothetical protein
MLRASILNLKIGGVTQQLILINEKVLGNFRE